ncbi:MAG: LLM class flavin-dependent oxidoreductase, partial [Dehalococcoidia bacterium]|nr:LLM class flavin-dependent oxidoreductase [Dehalococcoidia bacterium]
MSEKRVGIMVGAPVILGPNSNAVLDYIEKAEKMGISAAWCTTSMAGLDALTLFAGASGRTQQILFGTAIVTSFPRHPVVMAQQVQVI